MRGGQNPSHTGGPGGLLPSVDPLVDDEVGAIIEALPAVGTLIGVGALVGDGVGAAPEALPTLGTLLGLLTMLVGGQG